MNAGVQAQRAVMLLRESTKSNPYLKERIDGILRGIRLGHNPGAAMFQAGFEFPDRDLVEEMAVYAAMPGFPEELLRIGREWTEEVTGQVKKAMGLLNGLATVLVGIVVMWLSTGMFSVSQQISSSIGGG
jgi:type II secretory pathway component PulF